MVEVCKLESYSTRTVTIICIEHNFQQYCFHCKLVPIKLHIVTASGISVIITTCFIILSLFNPVLIFKIAFTNSALILLFNFNFTMFIWPITRFITELECGIGYIMCWAKQASFSCGCSPTASPYEHTSVQYVIVSVTFLQWTIIKFCQWYSIFPMTSLSNPNLSKN